MTRMCSWPWAHLGNCPARSIPMPSKGTSMMGSGLSWLGGGVLGDVFCQVGQDWQKRLTSASIVVELVGWCWPLQGDQQLGASRYRSRKRLGRCWEDSPSLPLSDASKPGHWRAPFTGFFPRRLPLGLTGCMAAASRWSKPGQFLPRRTGTSWSFTTPTSTCQVPGAAEMFTLRTGTCHVSPCTHVIGTQDFTRLIALPSPVGRGTGGRWSWPLLLDLPLVGHGARYSLTTTSVREVSVSTGRR